MPEYAEIYTLQKELKKFLGKEIKSYVSVGSTSYPKIVVKGILENVSQEGKLLILTFNQEQSEQRVGFHLGMTGRLSLLPLRGEVKVKIAFTDGIELFLYDPRKFGWAKTLRDREGFKYEEDLLAKKYQEKIKERILGRNSPIFSLLLNQKIARGVGSYLAQETLFAAEVSPSKKMLNEKECDKIVESLDKIVRKAIKLHGASMRDYFTLSGQKGKMQLHFKVYGRAGEPCIECALLLSKTTINNRGVTYCTNCQK